MKIDCPFMTLVCIIIIVVIIICILIMIMIEKVAGHRRTHNHDFNPCQVPMADDDYGADDDGIDGAAVGRKISNKGILPYAIWPYMPIVYGIFLVVSQVVLVCPRWTLVICGGPLQSVIVDCG